MAPLFPAIFIGGPPHAGKSTLLYRLSHALRRDGIDHYALRASPDGEGDWSQQVPDATVRELRMRAKSYWTPHFAEQISTAIDQRHLPLLVDAGGKVSPESALIAAACTHAVLLAANVDELPAWRALLAHQGRPLIAELRSALHEPQRIDVDGAVLRGTISGLARDLSSDGVCFTALRDRLTPYLAYDADQLYHTHCTLTSVDLVLHLERALPPLPAHTPTQWEPRELPALLASLPAHEPLAIYGRGPNWLVGALAAFTEPVPQIFSPFLGWVTPPRLVSAAAPDVRRLQWDCVATPSANVVTCSVPGSYLDYADAHDLPVPIIAPARGVVLSGKLPQWLIAALAQHYRARAAWIAFHQPQVGGAVVVWSHDAPFPVGAVVALGG